jgi:hypothetical protein
MILRDDIKKSMERLKEFQEKFPGLLILLPEDESEFRTPCIRYKDHDLVQTFIHHEQGNDINDHYVWGLYYISSKQEKDISIHRSIWYDWEEGVLFTCEQLLNPKDIIIMSFDDDRSDFDLDEIRKIRDSVLEFRNLC